MKPTRMQTNMRRTLSVLRSAAYSFSLRATFEVIELQYPGYQRFFSHAAGIFGVGRRPTHLPAVGRSHEPDRNRAKNSLWHPGGQGFESHTSLNFSWLSFAAAKNCVKNAMIFFHIIQLTLLKVSKTFEGNVSAAHSWVRCLTHGAFHVPYTTCIPEIGVLVSQSFRG